MSTRREHPDERGRERRSGPLRVRSVVGLAYDELRAMIVDGRLAARRRASARRSSRTRSGSPAARSGRRFAASPATGSSSSRSTAGSSSPTSGSSGCSSGSRRASCSSPASRASRPSAATTPTSTALAAVRSRGAVGAVRPPPPTTRAAPSTRPLVDATRQRGPARIFDSLWIADVGRSACSRAAARSRSGRTPTSPSTRSCSTAIEAARRRPRGVADARARRERMAPLGAPPLPRRADGG